MGVSEEAPCWWMVVRQTLDTDPCLPCVSAVWTGSSTASYTPVGAQQNGRAHQQAALHHPGHHCELLRCYWTSSLCCQTLHAVVLFQGPNITAQRPSHRLCPLIQVRGLFTLF